MLALHYSLSGSNDCFCSGMKGVGCANLHHACRLRRWQSDPLFQSPYPCAAQAHHPSRNECVSRRYAVPSTEARCHLLSAECSPPIPLLINTSRPTQSPRQTDISPRASTSFQSSPPFPARPLPAPSPRPLHSPCSPHKSPSPRHPRNHDQPDPLSASRVQSRGA